MSKMTVRMTIRIDDTNRVDVAFLRAVLRRLDIAHCTAKNGNIRDIIDPAEYGILKKNLEAKATVLRAVTPPGPYVPPQYNSDQCGYMGASRPWRGRAPVELTYISEIRMPLPIVPPDRALVVLDNAKKV